MESRLVQIYWDDGLLDLLSGLGLVLIGVGWQLDLVPLSALAPALLIPLWKPLRERLTEPRLGYAELAGTQTARTRSFLRSAAAAGGVTFLAATGFYLALTRSGAGEPGGLAAIVPALPAVLLAALALATSWLVALPRFLLYAAGLVAAGLAVAAFELRPGWSLLAGGALTLLGGVWAARRFRQRYPQPSEPTHPDV